MRIDKQLVLRIAELAHLELTEQEVEVFSQQLTKIVNYIEKIKEADGAEEPFVYNIPTLLRPDEVRPSPRAEENLQNAPETAGRFFKVPRILP